MRIRRVTKSWPCAPQKAFVPQATERGLTDKTTRTKIATARENGGTASSLCLSERAFKHMF